MVGRWHLFQTSQYGAASLFPLAIILGVLIGIASIWSSNKEALGLFHDDGIYAVVGKSLSDGAGYRIISLPTFPEQTKYPFLYSAILSRLWSLNPQFPSNIGLLKSANGVFLVAVFVLSYLFYRHRVPKEGCEALLFAVLICINPVVFSFTDFTVSDILFLMLSLATLVVADGLDAAMSPRRKVTFLAVVVALACLTRSAAVPLAVAGVIHFAWNKHYRDLISYTVLVTLFVLPWWLWVKSHSDQTASSLLDYYVSYSSEPPAFVVFWFDPLGALEIVWGNLRYIADGLDLIFQSTLIPGLGVILKLLVVLGLWKSFKKQSVYFRSYACLYLALIVAWPFQPLRYLMPLMPAIYLFLLRGIHFAEDNVSQLLTSHSLRKFFCHVTRLTFAVVVVLQVGWFLNYLLYRDSSTIRVWFGKRLPASWQGFSETFDWVRNNSDESTILATAYDPMYYLYTGRRAIQPGLHKPKTYFYPYGNAVPDVGSAEEIKAELKSLGVEFLILHPLKGMGEEYAYGKLWTKLRASYRNPPKLIFVSSDAKHHIYALPQE